MLFFDVLVVLVHHTFDMAVQNENSTHIYNLKLMQSLAHIILHIIEIEVKCLRSQCCLLNTCFFMLFMDVLWMSHEMHSWK